MDLLMDGKYNEFVPTIHDRVEIAYRMWERGKLQEQEGKKNKEVQRCQKDNECPQEQGIIARLLAVLFKE